MEIDEKLRRKAVEELTASYNNGLSHIDNKEILSRMAKSALDELVHDASDGWKRFQIDKGGEDNFPDQVANLRKHLALYAENKGLKKRTAHDIAAAIIPMK